MAERDSLDNWQLQEGGEKPERWQLLDNEQRLPTQLTLEQQAPGPDADWKPVEYNRPRSGGLSWIMPMLIVVALVAVAGFLAWFLVGGIGDFLGGSAAATAVPIEAEDPEVTSAISATVPAEEAPVPTVPPTPTVVPSPTLEPTPEPPALVSQEFGQSASQYGVNIRAEPNVNAEILYLLEGEESVRVVGVNEAGWAEVLLNDGRLGWVSVEFLRIYEQMVPPDEAIPTPEPEVSVPDASGLINIGIVPPEPFTSTLPVGPAVVITVTDGVNARTEPSVAGDILLTVPQGAALAAVSRNAGGDWVQVSLPNGTLAWVFLDAVQATPDIGTLLVAGPDATEEATVVEERQLLTPTVGITATTGITVSSDVTSTSGVTTTVPLSPTVTIDNSIGVNARSTPSADAEVATFIAGGSSLPAVGRSANRDWILVLTTDDERVWVFAGAVELNVDVATLPTVEP